MDRRGAAAHGEPCRSRSSLRKHPPPGPVTLFPIERKHADHRPRNSKAGSDRTRSPADLRRRRRNRAEPPGHRPAALCAADSLRRKWIGGNGLAAKRAANLAAKSERHATDAARIADRAGAVIVHEPDTYRRSKEAELAALSRLQEEVARERVIGNEEETG